MQIHTLASSSSGNCILVSHHNTHVLVDAGISCRKITTRLNQLGLTPDDLSGILVTHTHSDHIGGLQVLLKKCEVPVFASERTGRMLFLKISTLREEQFHAVAAESLVCLNDVTVFPFDTPHDAPGSMGYVFSADGQRSAVVTDLGYLAPQVLNALQKIDLAVIEANHDVDWLRTGPYPISLQERVLGSEGHLSNELCGDLAVHLAQTGTRTMILAHLSKENNTPQRALESVSAILTHAGYPDVSLQVAPRDELSPCYCIENVCSIDE